MGGSSAYKNAWIAEKLDRVNLTMPKGRKEELTQYAKDHGFRSLNHFLNEAADLAIRDGFTNRSSDD